MQRALGDAQRRAVTELVRVSPVADALGRRFVAAGHEIALMDEARLVPSGVVRLIELQEQGYAYIRP